MGVGGGAEDIGEKGGFLSLERGGKGGGLS